MDELTTWAFWASVFSSSFRLATPIALAALGETVAERAGVINLGLEGYMAAGALTALIVANQTDWRLGVLAGAAAGLALAGIMALLSVRERANQIVVGFGLTILGLGASAFAYNIAYPVGRDPVKVEQLRPTSAPGLADIPGLGPVLFQHNAITWFAVILTPVLWWVLARTSWGIAVRACGEDPEAAAARGIRVVRVRSAAVLVAGALAGVGGAAITVALLGLFVPNVTSGRGFVAIAVVLMGRWNPLGVGAGSLAFGFAAALSLRLQTVVSDAVPTEALDVLPFLVTLLVLVLGSRIERMPRALGRTFVPER